MVWCCLTGGTHEAQWRHVSGIRAAGGRWPLCHRHVPPGVSCYRRRPQHHTVPGAADTLNVYGRHGVGTTFRWCAFRHPRQAPPPRHWCGGVRRGVGKLCPDYAHQPADCRAVHPWTWQWCVCGACARLRLGFGARPERRPCVFDHDDHPGACACHCAHPGWVACGAHRLAWPILGAHRARCAAARGRRAGCPRNLARRIADIRWAEGILRQPCCRTSQPPLRGLSPGLFLWIRRAVRLHLCLAFYHSRATRAPSRGVLRGVRP